MSTRSFVSNRKVYNADELTRACWISWAVKWSCCLLFSRLY